MDTSTCNKVDLAGFQPGPAQVPRRERQTFPHCVEGEERREGGCVSLSGREFTSSVFPCEPEMKKNNKTQDANPPKSI